MDFTLTEQHELIRKEVTSLARAFPPEYSDRSRSPPP